VSFLIFEKKSSKIEKVYMLEAKRKPREPLRNLISRFNYMVLRSGILLEARKRLRRQQPRLNERKKKEKALRRLAKIREALEKEGKE